MKQDCKIISFFIVGNGCQEVKEVVKTSDQSRKFLEMGSSKLKGKLMGKQRWRMLGTTWGPHSTELKQL